MTTVIVLMLVGLVTGGISAATFGKVSQRQNQASARRKEAARQRGDGSAHESPMPLSLAGFLFDASTRATWLAPLIEFGTRGTVRWYAAELGSAGRSLRAELIDPRVPGPLEAQWLRVVFGDVRPGAFSKHSTNGPWPDAARGLSSMTSRLARDLGLSELRLDRFEKTALRIGLVSGIISALAFLVAFSQRGLSGWTHLLIAVLGLLPMFGIVGSALSLHGKLHHLTPKGERALSEIAAVERLVDRVLADQSTDRAQLSRLFPWAALFGKDAEWLQLMVRSGVPMPWLTAQGSDAAERWNTFVRVAARARDAGS